MATGATGPPASGTKRVAIAGLGAIGEALVQAFAKGINGLDLAAVAARDKPKAEAKLARSGQRVPVVAIADLEPLADIVVECAPANLLPEIAEPFLRRGKTVVVLSCGALLTHDYLLELARTHNGQIIVPTGALIGLDAVTAAAEGQIRSVRMITRKPPRGLEGAPYIKERDIDLSRIAEPTRIFCGSPRDAAVGFPANLNVAVALSLAGIGPDRTQLELWADPSLDRNVHRIEVEADSASFSMEIANVPSENPRTGRITALSVVACLRKLHAPLRMGT
jgi:aspartate dehydrogenase